MSFTTGLLLMLAMVVPIYSYRVQTNHLQVDAASHVLVSWAQRTQEFFVYMWVVFMGCAGQSVRIFSVLAGLAGLLSMGRRGVVHRLQGAGIVMLAAALGVGDLGQGHVAGAEIVVGGSYLPTPQSHAHLGAFPVVVTCQRTHGQLMGREHVGEARTYQAPLESNETQPWARDQPTGTWVVDSGAELDIAGAFMGEHGSMH